MRFAQRAEGLTESATMRVARKASALRAAGRDIVDLGPGEPDGASPAIAVAAVKAALDAGQTRYTAAAGLPALRRAVAERYTDRGAPWTAEDTVVCVGAKAALFQLVQVLVEPGDEVVIPTPAWVSFEAQVRFAGGRPVMVPTRIDDGFALHAETVIAAMGPRTKAVVINTPSNPTGGRASAPDLEAIAVACAERDAVLISDETYDRFVWDGVRFASAAGVAHRFPDHVAVVGSFSKTWAMTGWRIGFALGPRALVAKVIALQSHTTSNPTSFAMAGALAVLEDAASVEAEVERMLARYARRRDLAVRMLSAMPGVRCVPPAGAFYVFPDVSGCYRSGVSGSIAFAERLLDAGVAVVPGTAFGADDHVRISFAAGTAAVEKGLARMAAALSSSP